MAWIAEFTLSATDFPLGRLFDHWPTATLELDRVVPSGDTVMPFFWVHLTDSATDLESIEEFIDDLPELRQAVLIEDLGDKGLFWAEWEPEYMGIMAAIPAADLAVLSASGSGDGWVFELRARNGDQLSRFQRLCEDEDIEVSLTKLTRLSEQSEEGQYDLTPEQQEALLLAFDNGYYEDPRETDIETLAEKIGITRQAFSSRLRRGYRNLLASTIVEGAQLSDS